MERDVWGLDLVRKGLQEGALRQALQGIKPLNGAEGQRCPRKLAEQSLCFFSDPVETFPFYLPRMNRA